MSGGLAKELLSPDQFREYQSYFYQGEESAFARLLPNQQGTLPNQVLTQVAHSKGCGQSKQGTNQPLGVPLPAWNLHLWYAVGLNQNDECNRVLLADSPTEIQVKGVRGRCTT